MKDKFWDKLMKVQDHNHRLRYGHNKPVCGICGEVYDKRIKECCYFRFIHSTWECKEAPAPCCPKVKNDKKD